MKKFIAICLILTALLGLAACTAEPAPTEPMPTVDAQAEKEAAERKAKEDAAYEVVRLINAIGSVTVNSADAIAAARTAYNGLTGDTQQLVTNADVLLAAEAQYTTAKAAQVDEMILAIGEVTLENGEAVNRAWEAYHSCHPDVQLAVKNTPILQDAKNTLSALKAGEVDQLIQAIGKVTLKKEAKILKAENAYAALSAEEAALVTGKQTLVDARAKLTELEKAALLKKLKTKTDKTQGITWYLSQEEPKYVTTRSYVLPYIGVQEGRAWLGLRCHYTGPDWVFFESVTVVADGQAFSCSFAYFDVQRDNQGGKVWEWVDVDMTDSELEMIRAIADSQVATVRFAGDLYEGEFTVKETDKQAIRDVLAAFEYLK